jgi:ferric-dicitrate binding protein FerR (iron transport regulator)
MQDTEQIHNLLPRYCEGNVSDEEANLVRKWMEESPENRRIVKQIHTVYLATDAINVLEKADTENALRQARRKIDKRNNRSWFLWVQQAAAILFIPLLIAFLVEKQNGPAPQEEVRMMEVKTNPGMTTIITLPDQTQVHLNSESSLTYPSRFSADKREVTLKGEAYFMVAKDEKKKFIVTTPHQSHIEVLGTHFNVDAYEDEPVTSATLTEGSIRFNYTHQGAEKKVTLVSGQKVVYDTVTNQVRLVETSGESETAWKDGRIVFYKTPMAEALRMLEKRYNVKFIVSNKRIMNDSFTGTFTHQRLERILELFKVSSRINWRYVDSDDMSQEKSEIEIY